MRYFLFVSILLTFFIACSKKPYRDLVRQDQPDIEARRLKPSFEKVLYRGTIDGKKWIKKYHFSGILYIRNFPDSTTRVVFQNEMGATFFDFGWDRNDSFQVFRVIPQMDKKPLIRLLRKDFEMLLLKQGLIKGKSEGSYKTPSSEEWYTRFSLPKGFVFYISTNPEPTSGSLKRIENADDKRKVIVMDITPSKNGNNMPQHISINHLRAGFTIDLKKIEQDAAE
jgi:hypothetical protein